MKIFRTKAFEISGWILLGFIGYLISTVFLPQFMLFPYVRKIGETALYSETPIPNAAVAVLARSGELLHASPIYKPGGYGRNIFLTTGGFRWHVLAFRTLGSFAVTQHFSEAIIVNRSDFTQDKVWNNRPMANERSLSGVIAHERTHGLIRSHFGLFADKVYPAWVREGYCDEVAGSGSLTDQQAQDLIAHHQTLPALIYYLGRKRVDAILKANGGSVDALFAGSLR